VPGNLWWARRAGRGEVSRSSDVAEGTFPLGTVLFKVAAGSTLEALVVVKKPWVGRGLLSMGSSPFWRVRVVTNGMVETGNGVQQRGFCSSHRKDK